MLAKTKALANARASALADTDFMDSSLRILESRPEAK
jgi:hypothetical protein